MKFSKRFVDELCCRLKTFGAPKVAYLYFYMCMWLLWIGYISFLKVLINEQILWLSIIVSLILGTGPCYFVDYMDERAVGSQCGGLAWVCEIGFNTMKGFKTF